MSMSLDFDDPSSLAFSNEQFFFIIVQRGASVGTKRATRKRCNLVSKLSALLPTDRPQKVLLHNISQNLKYSVYAESLLPANSVSARSFYYAHSMIRARIRPQHRMPDRTPTKSSICCFCARPK